MNWNWPGEISVTPPIAVQLLNGAERFVAAKTPNVAPTVLVKENWNDPAGVLPAWLIKGVVGTGTLMLITELVLGIPLTKTVAKAKPGGKFQTGSDVKEFVD